MNPRWQQSGLRRYLFDREVLGLMGLAALIKPIGLLNQVLIARWFGAGAELDAYALAFFLVTFGEGTLAQVFKGSMAPYLIQRKRALELRVFARYQNGVLALFLGSGTLWLLALALGAPLVVAVLGPDLPAVTSDLAIQMTMVMAIPGLLMMANSLGISILDLNQYFRLGGTMPVLSSLAMLAALLFWHDSLGIWALPAGFALAQALQWPLVHLRALLVRALLPVRPMLERRELRKMGDLVGLALIGQVLLMVNAFLDRWFATGLEIGSIASLAYGLTLTNFGLVLFTTSLVTVMYPRMSEAIAAGDLAGCSEYIRTNLSRVAYLVVPASLAAALAAPEIVQVLFQRGAFDAEATVRTGGVTTMYLLGLPAMIINGLVARIFHSLQLLRDKVWLALQYLVTNALLNFALIGVLQVQGLALASTLAINLHLLLSLWILHRRGSGLATDQFTWIVGRAYAVGLATGLIYLLLPLATWLRPLDDAGTWGVAIAGASKALVILVVYGAMFTVWRWVRERSRA